MKRLLKTRKQFRTQKQRATENRLRYIRNLGKDWDASCFSLAFVVNSSFAYFMSRVNRNRNSIRQRRNLEVCQNAVQVYFVFERSGPV